VKGVFSRVVYVLSPWYRSIPSVGGMAYGEADTRAKLIDPAIHSRGWTEDLIRREETLGAIERRGRNWRRARRGRTDYTLRIKLNPSAQPIAVALIEAKPEDLPPTHGLEQVKLYANSKKFNVPFVYSSNGHLFVEYDRRTGLTSAPRPMTEFPTPSQLRARYEEAVGFSLEGEAARPLLVPYPGGEGSRRYYQDAAIRAALEKIARGEKRALLSLATGSGKTFIAVHMLRKIADAGQLRRALFVCDRDELRNQAAMHLTNEFGSDAQTVSTRDPQKNARIVIATYQTLDVASDESAANFLRDNYPENYFSHIIIDECHRSAWNKWSEVLTRNPTAIQVGLTATPRQLEVVEDTDEAREDEHITADNIRHFGEPAYEYSLAEGMEDGYLAGCEVQKGRVNLDDTGITLAEVMARHPTDMRTGAPVSEAELRELYDKTSYEARIQLPDRVMAMCADLFKYFCDTGSPEQKTIIFCVSDPHADAVAIEMNNLYAKWCSAQGKARLEPYAFKCTSSVQGADFVPDLRGASRSHFVATTVDLLTTGVDVPSVRNIVFFKYVRSSIAFHQMLGRGTRIDEATGKLMFHVYDYTDATRLLGQSFITKITQPRAPEDPEPPSEPQKVIRVEGFEVHISDAGRFIMCEENGQTVLLTIEQYRERLARRTIEQAPTIEVFRSFWIDPLERHALLNGLPGGAPAASVLREAQEMRDYDLYDVLGDAAYGVEPHTRIERADAFNYKHADWLSALAQRPRDTLRALAEQFSRDGTEALESPHVFQTPEVVKAGSISALRELGKPSDVLKEIKERIFAA